MMARHRSRMEGRARRDAIYQRPDLHFFTTGRPRAKNGGRSKAHKDTGISDSARIVSELLADVGGHHSVPAPPIPIDDASITSRQDGSYILHRYCLGIRIRYKFVQPVTNVRSGRGGRTCAAAATLAAPLLATLPSSAAVEMAARGHGKRFTQQAAAHETRIWAIHWV